MYKYSSPGEENNSLINNEHKMEAHVLKWVVEGGFMRRRVGGNKRMLG